MLKGALEQEATGTCNDDSFDSGVCGENECTNCVLSSGDVEIPTNPAGFQNPASPGSLTCGQFACLFGGDSNYFFDFKNPSDYLVCGLSACLFFHAKDVGGLCCIDGCANADIQLAASTGGDVCCRKGTSNSACNFATLTNVRNMACVGNSCERVKPTLTGNLLAVGSFAGQHGEYTFVGTQNHCIRSIVPDRPSIDGSIRPFLRATFTFEQPSNIVMECDGEEYPCQNANVELPEGSCFHVKCEAATSCYQLVVRPKDDGKDNFQCHCTGSQCDAWTATNQYCSTTTAANPDPCGTNVCPGNLPACVADETAAAAQTVDCTRLANTAGAAGAGTVQGDPHLSTLDGRHYTLMQQGNFLLWSFSGYETEVLVKKAVKKVHVDFEIFAHYAGHASFTKGLLFVDKSSKPNQALEVTAKDCLWHHRDGDASKQWQPVESALLKLADSDGSYGAFNLSMSKSGQRKLEISINHQGKVRTLAQLWVGCRAGHQLSAKIKMPSQKDFHFVRGELAPGRLSLATAAGGEEGEGYHEGNQMATDPEFALTSDWGDLGGSPAAASYFKAVDATGPAHAFKACEEAEKEEHAKTCQKHLADSAVSTGFLYQQAMDDCIFDLCRGGDETSAELAAEILNA